MDKTTLLFIFGTFQFELIPSGLMNVPSTFQRMMYKIFSDLNFFCVYLADVLVLSHVMGDY